MITGTIEGTAILLLLERCKNEQISKKITLSTTPEICGGTSIDDSLITNKHICKLKKMNKRSFLCRDFYTEILSISKWIDAYFSKTISFK